MCNIIEQAMIKCVIGMKYKWCEINGIGIGFMMGDAIIITTTIVVVGGGDLVV